MISILACGRPCLARRAAIRTRLSSSSFFLKGSHASFRELSGGSGVSASSQQGRKVSGAERKASSSLSLSADAAAAAASPQAASRPPPPPPSPSSSLPSKPTIVGRKAVLSLTPQAVSRIQTLLEGPKPQLIRIGVRNKGCAGQSYHLEYVERPARFDEVVEQDGVRVLVDSKALFSIIGSEMDWVEDELSAKFAFKNPNIKDACGCGESFTVGNTPE